MAISISKTVCSVLLVSGAVALAAQTTPSTATAANTTMTTNPAAKQTTTTTTTTTTKKKTVHHAEREIGANKPAAYAAATRLASLLADTQDKATLSADAWKTISNEATALGDRLGKTAKGSAEIRTNVIETKKHLHEMHEAAMKGDADGARAHAGMAMPYVSKLIDWSTPAK
jgi:hypothetical protein